MCKRLVDNRKSIEDFQAANSDRLDIQSLLLSKAQWGELKEITDVLYEPYWMTVKLQSSSMPLFAAVVPMLKHLEHTFKGMLAVAAEGSLTRTLLQAFISAVQSKCTKYYSNVLVQKTMALCPLTKSKQFGNEYVGAICASCCTWDDMCRVCVCVYACVFCMFVCHV
jgi:hypothetical protein